MPILEGKGVITYFGVLAAISSVDFTVEQGETLDEVYRLFPILKARQGHYAVANNRREGWLVTLMLLVAGR